MCSSDESHYSPVNDLNNVEDVPPSDILDNQSTLDANRSYEMNNFETLFIKDIDNYNQLRILINFCNTDSNINLINFINEEKDNKKTFINYLELFNSSKINENQVGGVNY